MKKALFVFCLALLVVPALQSVMSTARNLAPQTEISTGSTGTSEETDKALARVNSVDGYYIFFQCTPVAQYEILGTVKRSGTFQMSNSPEAMYTGIIKRVKKEFPKADGIIFDGAEMERASCIRFK